MTAPLSVSAQARDLRIELTDSCNCCCFNWQKKVPEDTRVYVSSRGQVVRFDPTRSRDEARSVLRCVSNLREIIVEMSEAQSKDAKEIMDQIDRSIVQLKCDSPIPITLDMVRGMIGIVTSKKGSLS